MLKSNYDAWYGCRVVREVYINILNASAQKPARWLYVLKKNSLPSKRARWYGLHSDNSGLLSSSSLPYGILP